MARARIYPWRRMRRSRAPSKGLGRFFAAQFSAGCTTNMSGFDFRQAHRYVCPEWTWPADEVIHIREMSERTSLPASSLRYYEKLGLITSERETSGSQRR